VKISYVGQIVENVSGDKVICGPKNSLPVFTSQQVRDWKPVFRFLNEKDRDILYLIFVSRKKQKVVQRILGRSQPSLCYDIRRIRSRLKFIHYLNSVSDIFLSFVKDAEYWRGLGFDTETIEVLTMMFNTTSYTHAANVLNKRQINVRYLFCRALERLEELQLWEIYEIFDNIRNNLNIVKRIYRGYDEDGRDKLDDVFIPS